MLAYVTIGSNDLERSIAFYDAILGELGAKRVSTGDRMVLWSAGRGKPMVGVCTPFDSRERNELTQSVTCASNSEYSPIV